jgi:hypothetical protein
MMRGEWNMNRRSLQKLSLAIVFSLATVGSALAAPTTTAQKTFASPQEAAKAFATACEQQDTKAMLNLLGPGGEELVNSGDEVQDNHRRERFAALSKESLEIRPDPIHLERFLVYVGNRSWPLPIPIIKEGDSYRFDTSGAKADILARRIGRNELDAIELLRSFVQAQIDYAYSDLNSSGMRDYAQKIISDPGTRNGLYWEAKEGEPASPIADLVAHAMEQGYELPAPGQRFIYHGYEFRVLKAQGPNAVGGSRDYVVRGEMIGGFAFVAYPADYAVSGVKAIVVNQDGVVWEKDMGDKTRTLAAAIKIYNPDKSWIESPKEEIETESASKP